MANLRTTPADQLYPGPSLPSPDHIRLLKLQPDNENADIKCELIATELRLAQAYEALSYTWGEPLNYQAIHVTVPGSLESKEFSVTPNCYSALSRLRYKDRRRIIWIDALCINQSDIIERNHQVTLMSKIYSQATNVVIFLGHATQGSDLAIDFIVECDNPDSETSSLSYPKSEPLINALNNFFRQPWFTRVWVIQEATLSRSGVIYYGEKTLPWSAVKNFKTWNTSTKWLPLLPFVVTFEMQSFEKDPIKAGNIVLKALLQARHYGAMNPRDKVYALLPLLHSFSTDLNVTPNYGDSLAKVYSDCASSLVAECGLEILYAVQGRSSIENLPSWLPDWSMAPRQRVLGNFERIAQTSFWTYKKNIDVPHTPKVIPSTSTTRNTQIPSLILRAARYLLGTITNLSSAYFTSQGPFPLYEWKALLDDESVKAIDRTSEIPLNYQADGPLDYMFHKVIGAAGFAYARAIEYFVESEELSEYDEEDDMYESHVQYKDKPKGSWERIVHQIAAERSGEMSSKDGPLPYRDIPFYVAAQKQGPSYRAFVRFVLETCHSRRFFVTNNGYIGVAPAEAQVGGQIYMLVDTSVPFALRKIQKETDEQGLKQFQFVGECYMESKTWTDLGKASDEFQWVDIK
ncbi:hypothetical protein ACMFMF_011268 [Clarireedia jacksonii]